MKTYKTLAIGIILLVVGYNFVLSAHNAPSKSGLELYFGLMSILINCGGLVCLFGGLIIINEE